MGRGGESWQIDFVIRYAVGASERAVKCQGHIRRVRLDIWNFRGG